MKDVLQTVVADVLVEQNFPTVDFVIEHPGDTTHGDYATNVALILAPLVKQSPRELATSLSVALADRVEYVEKVEVAGPGFINFFLAPEFFQQELTRIHREGKEWGMNDTWEGRKVLVEYTDPNPFKEFHIGHLFTNTVGECFARLFEMAGAEVKRCNYQGDVGMHVAMSLWGLRENKVDPSDITPAVLGQAYAKGATAYKEGGAKEVEAIKAINKAVYEKSDEEVNDLYDIGRRVSLDYFEEVYALIGTSFDYYFFESEVGEAGKKLVLEHPEVFSESEGAVVFKGEEHGLHTRVFINSEGLPTYEAKELALPKLKEERAGVYDHSLISTSNEITEYFKVLLTVLREIYPDLAEKTEHIGHGTVRLTSGKMSSRTGEVVRALDFIADIASVASKRIGEEGSKEQAEQVALAAIKYVTLSGNVQQDTVFNEEKALSFEGNSGPYLQYTYARIQSVLAKAEAEELDRSIAERPKSPYEVERLLYRFEEVVEEALTERSPHVLTQYLIEIASSFNTWYAKEKLVEHTDPLSAYKLSVAEAVASTLQNGLWALGIVAPKQM